MSDDILDLDALAPPSKHIKISGKLIECKPLTIRQMIKIAQLERDLAKVTSEDQIMELIKAALIPFIPALATDNTIDFTIPQMMEIIKFAQATSIPSIATSAKEFTPKKKVSSAGELPTSSGSIPATPPKQS